MSARTLLYLSQSVFPSISANSIQVTKMSAAFAHKGICVNVIGLAGSTPPRQKHFKLHLVNWPFKWLRYRAIELYSDFMIWSLRPDVVYSRVTLMALKAANKRKTTIVELHSLPKPDSARARALRKLFYNPNLRRIVTISQALANDLAVQYGRPHQGCDILVAHDGADPGPRQGPMLEHDKPMKVGYFGHLYPGKGIEMIAALAPLLPDMHFEVYGGSDDDLFIWRDACVGQANLTLHGHIPHHDVAARMAECDILIAPYADQVRHAGAGNVGRWMSPLKLFEYMAAERPIVTTDLPVLREVVCDGQTALLCTPNEPAAFADALKHLAADPSLRARLGSNGRDLLEEKYTWEKRARRVLNGIVPFNDG